MALARITWQGLSSIAVLVAVLWGCFVAERLTVRNAQLETSRALRMMYHLKEHRQIEPAAVPVRHTVPVHPQVG